MLLESYENYKKIGIKFSYKLLIELAKAILIAPDFINNNES